MTGYLTTREIQDLLKVDRSTVYRMAEDGRLPGIKVGRQWRFPTDRIDALFGVVPATDTKNGGTTLDEEAEGLAAILPLDAIEALAELLGDLMGAMVIVTDMGGRPLTGVANACGLYEAFETHPGVLSKCIEGWRDYGDDPELEPRFRPSHFGFLCARGFIRVGTSLEGMVIVGGFAPENWPPAPEQIAELSALLGVSAEEFAAHVDEVFHAGADRLDMVLQLLPRISVVVSHLAASRSRLVEKLGLIADLASTTNAGWSTP